MIDCTALMDGQARIAERMRARRVTFAWMALVPLLAFLAGGCAGPDPAPEMTHHHTIDYIEFTVLDMTAAQRFYGEAFGWSFTDYGPDYCGIQRAPGQGDGEAGGMRLDTKVVTGGPLVILYSADLDATVTAVREAGGEIVMEPFDFPGGCRFHFKDPAGNELAVWGQANG